MSMPVSRQPLEERPRREVFHPCRGQHDGQRQPVEQRADILHRMRRLGRQCELRAHGLGTGDEELHRGRPGQRQHWVLLLAREAQRFAAGGENLQRRCRLQ
jgi:hypothetical protein